MIAIKKPAAVIPVLLATSLNPYQPLFAERSIETNACSADEIMKIETPPEWIEFGSILCSRMNQSNNKMKLTKNQTQQFVIFLQALETPTPELSTLKNTMPKTTLELLRAVASRGLRLDEAERMANYLDGVPATYAINNTAYFDENTSHIIGREWHEIDYSGEGMDWQQQKQKYAPYGITHFKSLDNLQRFFPIESTLPYFRPAYD